MLGLTSKQKWREPRIRVPHLKKCQAPPLGRGERHWRRPGPAALAPAAVTSCPWERPCVFSSNKDRSKSNKTLKSGM